MCGRLILLSLLLVVLIAGCRQGDFSRASSPDIRKGMEHLKHDRKKDAIAAFERAAASDPSGESTLISIAYILFKHEMYEEAVPFIRRGIDLPPAGKSASHRAIDDFRDSDMYVMLGDAFYRLKRVGDAEAAYGEAVRLNKDNATAYNNWGYMYADLDMKPDESLRLALRAVELQPGNGCFVDSVGWAYYRLGRMEEAVEYLKNAVRLTPNEPECREHLAKALDAIGDKSSALVERRKATLLSRRN